MGAAAAGVAVAAVLLAGRRALWLALGFLTTLIKNLFFAGAQRLVDYLETTNGLAARATTAVRLTDNAIVAEVQFVRVVAARRC